MRLILVLPNSGKLRLGITDKTNKAIIKITVAIILENVIFVGKFITYASSFCNLVSLRPCKPCSVKDDNLSRPEPV